MSLMRRLVRLEASRPRGVHAFLNMLDPRFDGMTIEDAKRAAGYDRLGPRDTLYVVCAQERSEKRFSEPSTSVDPNAQKHRC